MRQMDVDTNRRLIVNGGNMHKHGWEESGGRRAGEYGNAWHYGACFGVGWPAFEKTPAGTWAFLEQVVFPCALQIENTLQRYRSRPVLKVDYKYNTGERDAHRKVIIETRTIDLRPGEEATVQLRANNAYDTVTYKYESYLNSLIRETERRLESMQCEGRDLYAAASSWKLADLREKVSKGPTLHSKCGARGWTRALCGSTSTYVQYAERDEDVTCSRCNKTLASFAADRAAAAAEKADAVELTSWLRVNGPATAKTAKAALGWDTRRFNKAEYRASDVRQTWPDRGPQQYAVKA
jgi:hypothetical protein